MHVMPSALGQSSTDTFELPPKQIGTSAIPRAGNAVVEKPGLMVPHDPRLTVEVGTKYLLE